MNKKKPGPGGFRPGSGRPRKYDTITARVTLTLPAQMISDLTAIADERGWSRSELVTHIIDERIGAWLAADGTQCLEATQCKK